ncbi:FHA domain-containing protein [Streptomyces hoynatensis]|uniref:FHA domain-containing protein n=1 Tax=Streptomyces hoynatensis TaxID=1141874 RepID=A0A3A9YNJ9_9ACTN|nr:FHA domain-containing protein [Streptomyces hoynatensis]RKN37612.1 FHA domain-containing protein [Streptomyces hoynatensis]
MPTCPNGHQSVADEWCEVCGHRMLSPAVAPPPPPPPQGFPGQPGAPQPPAAGGWSPPPYPGSADAEPPAPVGYQGPGAPTQAFPGPQQSGGYPGHPGPPGFPEPGPATAQIPPVGPGGGPMGGPMGGPPQLCPQCRTPREGQAPFCEECRFNFLTNSPTTYLPPAPQQQGPPPGMDQPMYGRPQAPAPPQPTGDWVLPPPGGPLPPQGRQPAPPPYPGQPGPGHPGAQGHPNAGGPPQPGGTGSWVVTIGPDPEYFQAMMRRSGPEAAQLQLPAYAPEQQLPLNGPQVTIGRRRQSTGESPDIDLSRPPEDPGVSHQHAILVQQPDASWAVIDQDSTNGTTVNMAEDPIQPFVPVPLREGDRVHIGAWTTLTLYRN